MLEVGYKPRPFPTHENHPAHTPFCPQLLVNRSKRKRRRRADKALTGTEKVKIINMRTGKKVKLGGPVPPSHRGD